VIVYTRGRCLRSTTCSNTLANSRAETNLCIDPFQALLHSSTASCHGCRYRSVAVLVWVILTEQPRYELLCMHACLLTSWYMLL
jgi:hypothetical protein